MPDSFYRGKKVLVTGGAGFIGSHLAQKLTQLGAHVTIADNLSTGSIDNLKRIGLTQSFVMCDLEDYSQAVHASKEQQIVFHLAATIGGRGFIQDHPADCAANFAINQNTIKAAQKNGCEKVIFASSACVYPLGKQDKYGSNYLLKEEDAWENGKASADELYGWSKLMGEETIKAYYNQYGLKGASVRYVTAYGPYENESHAIIAIMKRALRREDPFVIWGSGQQDRDFTYVDDIVSGTLAAGEMIDNGSAINLGTGKRHSLIETANMIFEATGWKPNRIIFDTSKPEGVKSRALDNGKAMRDLGWSPKVDLRTGVINTLKWLKNEKIF